MEDQEVRALIDSGAQLSTSLAWVKKLNLRPQQLWYILQIEGLGGLDVPYLGYVETHLGILEIKAFDNDVLLLIVPDSTYTTCTPIMLGMLHIDMAIKLATMKELGNLNKQWKRSLIATKLTMKEAQIVNQEDAQIVSKIDSIVKLSRNTTIIPFGATEVKGVIKTPNHYKCVNVVIDDLPENQCCKDMVIIQQIPILKPGSNKIPVVLLNLSCRTLKIRKEMKIAHAEASKVVPSLVTSQLPNNILKRVAGNSPKSDLLENLPKEGGSRLEKLYVSLNLQGIESWTEQHQQSAKNLIMEYQHLFAMYVSELGRTSLVQHDLRLDDMTPS